MQNLESQSFILDEDNVDLFCSLLHIAKKEINSLLVTHSLSDEEHLFFGDLKEKLEEELFRIFPSDYNPDLDSFGGEHPLDLLMEDKLLDRKNFREYAKKTLMNSLGIVERKLIAKRIQQHRYDSTQEYEVLVREYGWRLLPEFKSIPIGDLREYLNYLLYVNSEIGESMFNIFSDFAQQSPYYLVLFLSELNDEDYLDIRELTTRITSSYPNRDPYSFNTQINRWLERLAPLDIVELDIKPTTETEARRDVRDVHYRVKDIERLRQHFDARTTVISRFIDLFNSNPEGEISTRDFSEGLGLEPITYRMQLPLLYSKDLLDRRYASEGFQRGKIGYYKLKEGITPSHLIKYLSREGTLLWKIKENTEQNPEGYFSADSIVENINYIRRSGHTFLKRLESEDILQQKQSKYELIRARLTQKRLNFLGYMQTLFGKMQGDSASTIQFYRHLIDFERNRTQHLRNALENYVRI